MKRVAVIVLLIWLSANLVFAQRTKNETFEFKYVQEPSISLPEHIKTYKVIISPGTSQLPGNVDFTFIRYKKQVAWYSAGSSSNYGSLELARQEFLNLYGYERTDDADLTIEAWFEPMIIKSKRLVYHEYCYSISKPCYTYDLTINYGAGFKITDKDGNVLIDSTLFDPDKDHRAWFGVGVTLENDVVRFLENNDMTFAYASSAELEERFQHSLEYNKAELTRGQLLKMEEIINDRYGFPLKEYKVELITGRTRKNRNYDDLDKAIELLQTGIVKFNEQADSSQWVPKFREAVAIWEEALKETDTQDKDARIYNDLAHGLLFNIGVTSIFLGDWDVVDNMALRGKDLSQDRSYAGKLIEFKDERKKRIENFKAAKSND